MGFAALTGSSSSAGVSVEAGDDLPALDPAAIEPAHDIIGHERVDVDEGEVLPDLDAPDLAAGRGCLAGNRADEVARPGAVALPDADEDLRPGRAGGAPGARVGRRSAALRAGKSRIRAGQTGPAGAPAGQRIEHAPLLTARLIEEIMALGVTVVPQPGLLGEVGARYRQLLDAAQRARLHPWRALLDAGGALGFSSDAPVSRASALESVAAASVDRPADLAPEQAIAPLEAVRAWTAGAADAARLGDRGRLREGALADLVLVDGPLDRDPSRARVRLTVVAGEVVFEADRGG